MLGAVSRQDNETTDGVDMALLFSMPVIITVLCVIIAYLGVPGGG